MSSALLPMWQKKKLAVKLVKLILVDSFSVPQVLWDPSSNCC